MPTGAACIDRCPLPTAPFMFRWERRRVAAAPTSAYTAAFIRKRTGPAEHRWARWRALASVARERHPSADARDARHQGGGVWYDQRSAATTLGARSQLRLVPGVDATDLGVCCHSCSRPATTLSVSVGPSPNTVPSAPDSTTPSVPRTPLASTCQFMHNSVLGGRERLLRDGELASR